MAGWSLGMGPLSRSLSGRQRLVGSCSQTTRRRRWASFMSVVGHRGHESSPRAAISVGDSFSFVRPALLRPWSLPAAESRFRRDLMRGRERLRLPFLSGLSSSCPQIKRAPIAANCCCVLLLVSRAQKAQPPFSFQLRPAGLKAERAPVRIPQLATSALSLNMLALQLIMRRLCNGPRGKFLAGV
jgi:hypothetical protein